MRPRINDFRAAASKIPCFDMLAVKSDVRMVIWGVG
jgi:hypothetical protein